MQWPIGEKLEISKHRKQVAKQRVKGNKYIDTKQKKAFAFCTNELYINIDTH